MEDKRLLDDADLEILRSLRDNARVSFAELSRKVGMTSPAIGERVRKMEESGVIRGYRTDVDPAKLGYPVAAFVGIQVPREHFQKVITLARDIAEVRECHHASGGADFVLKITAASSEALAGIVGQFQRFGETQASIILSTPVEKYSA